MVHLSAFHFLSANSPPDIARELSHLAAENATEDSMVLVLVLPIHINDFFSFIFPFIHPTFKNAPNICIFIGMDIIIIIALEAAEAGAAAGNGGENAG